MNDHILSLSTKTSMGLGVGMTGTEILGVQISDLSYIVVAVCAIVSTLIALLTYIRRK